MSAVLEGQLDLLALLDYAGPTKAQPSVDEQRMFCAFCRSNWGHSLKPEVMDRLAEEHAPGDDSRCAHMVARGVTEPYYAPGETPWLSGSVIQFPRPKGFGGFYHLQSQGGAA